MYKDIYDIYFKTRMNLRHAYNQMLNKISVDFSLNEYKYLKFFFMHIRCNVYPWLFYDLYDRFIFYHFVEIVFFYFVFSVI